MIKEADICEYESDNYRVTLHPKSKAVLDISISDVNTLEQYTVTDYELKNITVESVKRALARKQGSKHEIKAGKQNITADQKESQSPALTLTIRISTLYLKDIEQVIEFTEPKKISKVSLVEHKLHFFQGRVNDLSKIEQSSKFYSYKDEVVGHDKYQNYYGQQECYEQFTPTISIRVPEAGKYLIQIFLLVKTGSTTGYFYDSSSFNMFIQNAIAFTSSEGWNPINISKIVFVNEAKTIEVMLANENTSSVSAKNIVMTAKKIEK